ncbi:MAG: MYXO-CTERM sorting domain-containing protein [Myxococcota bacterium]
MKRVIPFDVPWRLWRPAPWPRPGGLLLAGMAALLILAPVQARGRPKRVNQIPNVPVAPPGCGTCHISPGGGGPRNAFGQDVESTLDVPGAEGDVQWALIFDLDSDEDGFTNGAELADPRGEWTGDIEDRPEGPVYAPGDADSRPQCGNGVVDPANDEDCDGGLPTGFACVDLGFESGPVSCSDACTFDVAECVGANDEGGCSATGGSTLTGWLALVGLVARAMGRRRRRGARDGADEAAQAPAAVA